MKRVIKPKYKTSPSTTVINSTNKMLTGNYSKIGAREDPEKWRKKGRRDETMKVKETAGDTKLNLAKKKSFEGWDIWDRVHETRGGNLKKKIRGL